jgi:hypothetical protein
MDLEALDSGWSTVRLILSEVVHFEYFRSTKISYDVLSNGLHIVSQGNWIGVEFGDFVNAPSCLDELKKSPCHIVASKISWRSDEIRTPD